MPNGAVKYTVVIKNCECENCHGQDSYFHPGVYNTAEEAQAARDGLAVVFRLCAAPGADLEAIDARVVVKQINA